MKRFYLLFTLLTVAVTGILPAQRLEQFSEVRAEFMSQLEEYMTAGKQASAEATYREFETIFKSGMFTDEEIDQILATGNRMLAQRMTANPYFSAYLRALIQIKNAEGGGGHFGDWHKVLDEMLADTDNRRLMPFQEFLSFSTDFFENGALRYSETGTSWYPLALDYQVGYDEAFGPYLEYDQLDLMASWKNDSILINETSGRYYPVEQIWRGKGGKVTWERFDWAPDIYAEFQDYEIELLRSLYEVKNARFHHPLFFGTKLVEGDFSDKLTTENVAGGGSYPRFESYDKRLTMRNVGEGIRYAGGFRIQGTTIYGFGSHDEPANIFILHEEEREIFVAKSEFYTIRPDESIVGERVEATLYLGEDSIYHPSVNVRFDIENKEIRLSRGKRGSDRNPFFSSIHGVSIDADNVYAYLDKDSVIFGKPTIDIANKPDIFFESKRYFDESEYRRIQNIASSNPVAIMKVTAEREGTNFLDADLIARRINAKFTADNIKSLLYDLAAKGFVYYDSDDNIVEVREKVFHYAEAEQGKVDYDNLRVRSRSDSINASLNLRDSSFRIYGVNGIEFSRRQKVAIAPEKQEIRMRKNRDMDFEGRLFAGFTTLEGKGFHFDYDDFRIRLDSVRYFDIFVPTGEFDQDNNPVAVGIGSRIENLSGVLLIDAPSNMSGRENIIMFPSLQTRGNSYVYYADSTIQDSAYVRDSFYFELDAFSFNHLDAFTEKDLRFEGKLASGGIFPDIVEPLTLQEDRSLGFIAQTPEDGLPNYQGKGNYTGEVDLSNAGLRGHGTQQYLGASVNSDDIVFRPDEMLATADTFGLAEDRSSEVQVPQVYGLDVNIRWRPYKDSLYVTPKEVPFTLFNQDNHTLDGTLILTPGGLKGDGILDWDKAKMESEFFSFGAYSAKADTTDLNIRAFDTEEMALKTKNVQGFVDFDKQIGTFKANEDFLETILPYNQYQTSMNEFDWDMKGETITFKTEKGALGSFVSTHPDQDSLRFQGADAFYDLKSDELNIRGVPFIIAADAFIYPDSNRVDIQPGGMMTTLENARIVADTISKYHVINRATVNILGRKEYRASGFYEYNIGDRQQEIEFADISGTRIGKGARSEKQVATRANGEVTEDDQFYIDHKTMFRGKISLASEESNLFFDGFARLDADRLPQVNWFTVRSEGDKEDLAIRYDSPKTYEGVPLETGLFLSRETAQLYPVIMMPLTFRKDRAVLPVKGIFKYDQAKDEFIFGDSTRVLNNELKGNKLVFNNNDGTVQAEGVFNLGSGLKYVGIEAAGRAKAEFPKPASNIMSADDTLSLASSGPVPVVTELMAGIKLIVPEKLMRMVALDVQSSSFDAKNINYVGDIEFYKKAATDLLPDEPAVKEAIEFMSSGFFDVPAKQNPYTFLLSPLKMHWNPEYQSFVTSEADAVGVISINGQSVNKQLTCHVEVKMPTNEDDRLYIHLASPSGLYYFFGFKQGILSMTSNNPKFMDELLDLKPKDLIQKMDDDETYEIQVVEPSTAKLFLRRMEAINR